MTQPRPPFDPAYRTSGGIPGFGGTLDIKKLREVPAMPGRAAGICLQNPHVEHTEHSVSVPGFTGTDAGAGASSTALLSVFAHHKSTKRERAVLYFVHGGGQILGDRFAGVEALLRLFADNDNVVIASIEYRLAPEHPAPAAAYDCYAGLVYLVDHATSLGIDPAKIIIYGISGGGGVAAAAVLLARQRGKNLVCAQMLSVPMLDDRTHFSSVKQFWAGTLWDGAMNQQAWEMILGPEHTEGADVGQVRCPGRATYLGGLPPTFIDVGECEVFRDSAVQYASGIWRDGGSVELHVWPGVHHGALTMEPEVAVSKAQEAAQKEFIERILRKIEDGTEQVPLSCS